MPDPGLYDPSTGAFDAWCPRCGTAIVKPGFWCEGCEEAYREETEFMAEDYSLQRDDAIANNGDETIVEPFEDTP